MSQLNDSLKITGSVRIQMLDENGKVIHEQVNPNLVVTAGLNYLAAWVAAGSQPGAFMSFVGLGTGMTAPTLSDTTLQSEFSGGGYSRQAGTLTSSGAVWQNVCTFAPGNGTGSVTEAGLFSVSSVGTMFARQVFSAIPKGAGNTLIVTWSVTFS